MILHKSLSALCNQLESVKPNETQHSDTPNVPCPPVNALPISDYDVLRKILLAPPASNSNVNESILTNSDALNETFATTSETMIPLMK